MNLYDYHNEPENLHGGIEQIDNVKLGLFQKVMPRVETFDAILDSPVLSYRYALLINKGRFPEGEEAIAKSTDYSYKYAKEVLEGAFSEGEDAIAKDARYSYEYAYLVLGKKRFPKGEPAIAKDSRMANVYAQYIIKGRWKEGEKAIMSNGKDWYDYQEFLKEQEAELDY